MKYQWNVIYFYLFSDLPNFKLRSFFKMIKKFLSYIIELAWLYAELHMVKIILLCVMFLTVYEVCIFTNCLSSIQFLKYLYHML